MLRLKEALAEPVAHGDGLWSRSHAFSPHPGPLPQGARGLRFERGGVLGRGTAGLASSGTPFWLLAGLRGMLGSRGLEEGEEFEDLVAGEAVEQRFGHHRLG